MKPVKLAVLGAGAIGKRHIEHVIAEPAADLVAIVDPSPAGQEIAATAGVPWHASFSDLMTVGKPEGLIVATPNHLHVANGLDAVAAGIPALIEKPIADDIASATKLVEAAEQANVALLVGHHRRHNRMVQRAKEIIESGRLGRIVAVHGFFWIVKPDAYFDIAWRRQKDAGPVLINLIHDVDLLRYLCGEIESVQARQSNVVRGNEIEDTAVVLLKFRTGALGTITVSDTIVAPWSWEQTTGENPAYPHTDQTCYYIGGTHGSLTLPTLEVWTNQQERGWLQPFQVERSDSDGDDPLRLQVRQFCRVVRGAEQPLVSGREGLKTLTVIDAVKRAAKSGEIERIDTP